MSGGHWATNIDAIHFNTFFVRVCPFLILSPPLLSDLISLRHIYITGEFVKTLLSVCTAEVNATLNVMASSASRWPSPFFLLVLSAACLIGAIAIGITIVVGIARRDCQCESDGEAASGTECCLEDEDGAVCASGQCFCALSGAAYHSSDLSVSNFTPEEFRCDDKKTELPNAAIAGLAVCLIFSVGILVATSAKRVYSRMKETKARVPDRQWKGEASVAEGYGEPPALPDGHV